MNNLFPRLRTRYLLKLTLIFIYSVVFKNEAYSQCDELICNPTITGYFGTSKPWNQFADSLVLCWHNVNGSSQLTRAAYSAPSAGEIWSAYYNTGPGTPLFLIGESFGQDVNIEKNKMYAFSAMIRRNGSAGRGYGNINFMLRDRYPFWSSLTDGIPPVIGSSNGVLSTIDNVPHQYIGSFSPSTSSWLNVHSCFKADDDYDIFVIFGWSAAPLANVFWALIDDAELFEVTANAGVDTCICDTGTCITLGTPCHDSSLHINRSFEWFISGQPSPFATTPQVTVCPNSTTEYTLKVTMDSCISYDNVTVYVYPKPEVDLGNDTTVCGPFQLILDAGFDSTFTYDWNTGDSSSSITASRSGVYRVIASNPCGCSDTDEIKLTIRPEFKIYPQDTQVCTNSFPVRISVDSGYQHYRWWNGDTLNYTYATHGDSFWVEVTDSGCTSKEWFHVYELKPPFVDLGPDKYICPGDSVQLCATSDTIAFMLKFLWNTGDTTRCITVGAQGTYTCTAWSVDSCFDSDNVIVTIVTPPPVSCPFYGPLCENDPPVILSGCSPSDLMFYGKGIKDSFYFFPSIARPGSHIILASYTMKNKPYCHSAASFTITVDSMPDVYITPVDPVCINTPPFELDVFPEDGGMWYGAINNKTVDPATLGPGIHEIIYSVDLPTGCSNADTSYILIRDSFDVYITFNDTALCNNKPFLLTANTTRTDSFNYLWNTGGSTQSILITQSGTYTVYVTDTSGGCTDSASVSIHLNNCCNMRDVPETSWIPDSISTGQYVEWNNKVLFIDRDVAIKKYATLKISNSTIYMRNCSKLIVEGGLYRLGAGHLIIENSDIGNCPWEGIEVWGNYDHCPITANTHGVVEMDNTLLSGANTGIFVGRRDSLRHYLDYAGGIIKVFNSHFKNNYVDIMFSERSFAGICKWPLIPGCTEWLSDIQNNLFDTLATGPVCNDYVDRVINRYQQSYPWVCPWKGRAYPPNQIPPPVYLPAPTRCHIIDLSPYTEVFMQGPWGYLCPQNNPDLVCSRCAWESGLKKTQTNPGVGDEAGNITNNNTYVDDCKNFEPASNYK